MTCTLIRRARDDGGTSEPREHDRLLDSFQQWQLGLFLLFVMGLTAGIATIGLQVLGVPYADVVGVIAGPAVAFLAFSYWYYGR